MQKIRIVYNTIYESELNGLSERLTQSNYNYNSDAIGNAHDERLSKKIKNSRFGKDFTKAFDKFFIENPEVNPFNDFQK